MDYWQINNSADFFQWIFTGFRILKNDKVKKKKKTYARMNNTKLDKKSDALKKLKMVIFHLFLRLVWLTSVYLLAGCLLYN